MDADDRARTQSNKAKLLALLKDRGVITNEQARAVAGSRAMGRCFELQKSGEPITTRKLKGGLWEIRYDAPALGRDSGQPRTQRSLFSAEPSGWQQ